MITHAEQFFYCMQSMIVMNCCGGDKFIMSFRYVCAIAMLAMAAGCAPLQDIEGGPEVSVKPAEAFAQSKSFIYERSIVGRDRGEAVVTLQAGLACVPHVQGSARSGQYAATDQEYENVFQEEFAAAGYRIARTVGSGDLFTDKKDIAADYRIAG